MNVTEAAPLHFPRELATDLSRVNLRQLDTDSEPLHAAAIERNHEILDHSGLYPEALLNPTTDAHRMGIWENDTLAGGLYITPTGKNPTGDVEISYWIDAARQGRHLGRVAVNAVVRHLVNELGVDVHASVLPSNTASMNLLQALKFEPANKYGTEFVRRSPLKRNLGAAAITGMRVSQYKTKRHA